jgi:hydrogenase maturation protease
MTPPRILIACIGNIFMGDDGFGTAVARRLARRRLPEGVVLKDFGIRGIDFTYALLDPWDLVIMVDACSRGGAPGTVYAIDPGEAGEEPPGSAPAQMEPHGMNPVSALRMVRSLGGAASRILVVGCEPSDLGSDEGKMGLSEPVEGALDQAAALVEKLIAESMEDSLC